MFYSLLKEYSLISKIIYFAINSALIFKSGSNFGEYVLNYVKLDTKKTHLIEKKQKILYIFLEFLLPLILEIIRKLKSYFVFGEFKKEKIDKIIKNLSIVRNLIDIFYYLKFILEKDFIYSNLVEHILGIMTVNRGSNDVISDKILNFGKQINLFFLYIFIKFGEWYFSKESQANDSVVAIEPPARKINNNSSFCPVCKESNIKEPVAVKCCGYVYCDNCLKNALKIKEQCSMCENELLETDIIKIYN